MHRYIYIKSQMFGITASKTNSFPTEKEVNRNYIWYNFVSYQKLFSINMEYHFI